MAKGNKRGLIRHLKDRLTADGQRQTLERHGFDPIFELGKDCSLEEAVRSFRRGDTVGVTRLHILPDPKLGKKKGRRQALYVAVDAIEDRGAVIHEVDTDRKSSDPKQRDGMIREAAEIVTKGGRGIKSGANGAKGGRPVKTFSDETWAKAEAIWFDMRLTYAAAGKKLAPLGVSATKAYKRFGNRSSKK